MELTSQQEDILLHSLGQSQTPNRKKMGWRRYFNVSEGCKDFDTCLELVEIGAMTRRGNYFFVTDEGAKSVGVTIKP